MTIDGEPASSSRLVAPIFAGGCPRSGLTLLRVILDGHSDVSCGPDAGVIGLVRAAEDFSRTLGPLHRDSFALPEDQVRSNFARAISRILTARANAAGKPRVAEKSAMNVLFFKPLFTLYPDAKFIHVVRDGRDVAASLLARRWRDPRSGRVFDYCADAGVAGRYWSELVKIGLEAERGLGPANVFRLAYEDLANAPEPTLRKAFAFLGLDDRPETLRFHARNLDLVGIELESAATLSRPINADAVGRWRRDLSPKQVAAVERSAGAELAALGYL